MFKGFFWGLLFNDEKYKVKCFMGVYVFFVIR